MIYKKRGIDCFSAYGTNLLDFFIIPTIRFHADDGFGGYLTIEWLKWYIGIKWFGKRDYEEGIVE